MPTQTKHFERRQISPLRRSLALLLSCLLTFALIPAEAFASNSSSPAGEKTLSTQGLTTQDTSFVYTIKSDVDGYGVYITDCSTGTDITIPSTIEGEHVVSVALNLHSLKSLDISAAIYLVELHCSDNSLTTLDISHNVALKNLYCENNYIVNTSALETWAGIPGNTGEVIPQNEPIISLASLSPIHEQTWTGSPLAPEPAVTYGGNTLTKDSDYTLTYTNNTTVGKATVTVSGLGIYTGTISEDFFIVAFVYTLITDGSSAYGNGAYITDIVGGVEAAIIPTTLGGMSVVSATLPGLSLTSLDVSAATGLKFLDCSNNSLTTLDVSATTQLRYLDCQYNELISLDISNNTQLVILYCGNNSIIHTSALQDWLAVSGHDGSISPQTTIDISGVTITFGSDGYEYTGSEIVPEPVITYSNGTDTVTLVRGTDYTVSYSDNIEIGTATVTLTGINNFRSTASKTFEISCIDIYYATVWPISDQTYTGDYITPEPIVFFHGTRLREYFDYTLLYAFNVDEGIALVNIFGVGHFWGVKTVPFYIAAADIASASITPISNQVWTGSAITPAPVLTFNGTTLLADTDYTLSYSNNVSVGTATITITGKGNFTSTTSTTFDIVARNIADASVAPISDATYTGSAITPLPVVTYGATTLTAGSDYTLAYSGNTSVGSATITITGTGHYAGTLETSFNIVAADIASASITAVSNQVWTGSAITPAPVLTFNGTTLTADTDYTLSYSNNVSVGTATITITGKGNFTSTTSTTFDIVARNIADAHVAPISDATYTGSAITPLPVVTYGATTLTAGSDYTLAYSGNTQVGSATVTITGTGNYAGTLETSFNIVAADIASATIAAVSNQVWTGSAITPAPVLTFNGATLLADTDYTLAYSNNVSVGTATITITGKGNFTSTTSTTFDIVARNIADAHVAPISDATYTGSAITPLPVVTYGATTLTAGSDYTLAYSGNTQVGSATVTITGTGHYAGTQEVSFNIVAADIASATIAAVSNQVWTGSAITPAPVLTFNGATLVKDTDYTLAYTNNTNVGTATITLSGSGNFTGTTSTTFSIVGRDISHAEVAPISDATYTGSAITPLPVVTYGATTLTAGSDYTLAYSGNTSVGSATITITGTGHYAGTQEVSFSIVAADIASATIAAVSNQVWTGSAITPAPVLTFNGATLLADTDYTLSYSNNVSVGTATIAITGKGNFTSTTSTTFDIVARNIADASVAPISDATYTGSAITPLPVVTYGATTLTAGSDYTLAYSGNTSVGSATITITGTGHYAGTQEVSFSIVAADIASATIAAVSNQVWTGSAITPAPVLTFNGATLLADTDYTLSYSNNVSVGTATIAITGKGNFTSTTSTTFDIVARNIADASVAPISDATYTGSAITPLPVVTYGATTLTAGSDYTLAYSGNTSVGSATITITGTGHYAGTQEVSFSIVAADIASATIAAVSNQVWTGSAITPAPVLTFNGATLLADTDYTLSYSNNVSVGTATIAITGKGNFTSTTSTTFDIVARNIADASVAPISDATYTGSAITPLPVVTYGATTLTAGSDYTLAYSGNTSVGSATITITGTGHYAGTQEVSFSIVAADIASATIAAVSNQVWTGSAITPAPVLTFNGATLLADTDYTLSYSNNVSVGTATITITGTGNFTSTTSTTFDIVGRDIADASVAPISDVTYTGSAITPLPVVTYGATTLTAGSDYTLAYSGNTSVGSATITITGTGHYAGTLDATFNIIPKSIASSVIAPISKKLYVGVPVEPTLAVSDGATTLTLGVDYTKSYTNNTVNGTATATITGIGNYTSTNSTDFTVVRFSDVSYDMWYITDGWLTYVVENDLMSGYAGTTEFGPLDFISRGQVATILYRAACNEDPSLIALYGSTTDPSNYATTAVFDDEATGVYYTAAINWAKAAGIMTGYGPEYTRVAPDNLISREELCAMITRYVRVIDPVKGAQTGPVDYSHIQGMDEVSDWALANVEWCASWGIIGGVNRGSGIFVMNPHDAAWRASMAKMITVSIRDVIG